MAYLATLGDLMVRVKQMMNKLDQTAADDTGKPSNAQIIAAINECRFEIHANVMERLADRFAITSVLTYPANLVSVALPAAAQGQQLIHVYTRDNTSNVASFQTVLSPLRLREFVNIGESGTPKYYAVTGTSIRLRPVPTSDANVSIDHAPALSALSVVGDTFPEMIPAFAHIYCLGAAIRLRQINEEGAGGLMDAYSSLMEQYVSHVERQAPDNHAQLVDPSSGSQWQG